MPTSAHEKATPRDLKTKKTKSRNGCGRCKLKRLKCDETAPSCLQCKKRNASCPGYEKTLKWSTKYEVLQPHLQHSPPKPRSLSPDTTASFLSPSVASGIEALTAVLPTAITRTASAETNTFRPATPPLQPLPALEEPAFASESTPEDDDCSQHFEPFLIEDIINHDALDDLVNRITPPQDEFNFNPFDGTDMGSGPLEDIGLDIHDLQQGRDLSPYRCSSLTTLTSSPTPNSRFSRSLLLDFYRLPLPSPNPSSPADLESLLIPHYFKDVCVVFSLFDGALNPFRTTVSRIYQDSPSIYYAIQSMAAAHLANTFPNMANIGLELQRKADNALQKELPLVESGQGNNTRTFLSIMLLGLTTGWHDSGDLGTEYLATARSLILPKLLCTSEDEEVQRDTRFFEESLLHWEMLMGFVTEDATSFSPPSGLRPRIAHKENAPVARCSRGKIMPHPWTGIVPLFQYVLAEVGRLVRRERSMDKDSVMDFKRRQENLFNAVSLEEDLLTLECPSVDTVADTGDERTPKQHFVKLAEVYRCAGLLELYRVFPSILRDRLITGQFAGTQMADFQFLTPRFGTPHEDTDVKLWLNMLALHILQHVQSIPSSSGTFCVQPLLLVIAASELKFVTSVDFFDVHANDANVLRARNFVIRRLQEYALRLANKPLRQMIMIIKETWSQSDAGQDAFWIDIMNEKGWQTIM